MDYDLTRGLRDFGAEAEVPDEVVPLADVVTRVRRARTMRGAAVGLVGAAAVIALAVGVQAVPFRPVPGPPAEPTPAPTSPAPTPTPTPTPPGVPAPTPTTETVPPVAPPPPVVALTPDGTLQMLDPGTGALRAEVTTDLGDAYLGSVSVAPDGDVAYVQAIGESGWPPEIYRVSLTDGSIDLVATGWYPAVSPDGGTLAFIGSRPGADPDTSMGLNLLELATGDIRHLPDEEWCECERLLPRPAWSPDGRQIAVSLGFGGLIEDADVTVVDVATAQSLGDGRVFGTREEPEGSPRLLTHAADPTYLPDGRLAVLYVTVETDENVSAASPAGASVEILDPATGEVTATVPAPDLLEGWLSTVGDGLVLVTVQQPADLADRDDWALHRWDGAGSFREIAQGVLAASG